MVGKLKKSSPGGHEYLLVAIEKFSKWIEAKPVRKADGATALKFVCSLVTRFGIPHSIITDNGTNFAQGELKDYCNDVGIRLDLASVAHPQSNDDEGSQKGGQRGLKVGPDHRPARPMAWPRHLWCGGPTAPFASFLRVLLRPANLSHSTSRRGHGRLCGGGEHQREKSSPAGRNPPGKFPPGGEIDAIVIELDIISIIIIIISTIYTAITTAAPRHRCNDLGWILIV
ncbi:hypothetical protein QYE76_064434 [Lolium multiflorum]|uniref:Integrase catalytic domain-containing protein n=1 Tax=Lolium multiflorum TaxID=4521 RepID=A0AAD8S7E6_LOLMU|nr:hypothetical protein QYE76_064434 [Lolium multiflorum]